MGHSTVLKNPSATPKVCVLVYNNFLHDSRVKREAETLIEAGYQVTVLALLDDKTARREERDGLRIIRVHAIPWYKRLLIWLLDWRGKSHSKYKGLTASSAEPLHTSTSNGALISGGKLYSLIGCLAPKRFITLLMHFHRQHSFFSFYCQAYRATAGEKYDIYHAHDLNTLPGAFLAARRDSAKLVYDSHELYVDRNKVEPSSRAWKSLLGRLEAFLARRADVVLTVNEALAEELARRYVIPRPCVVMNTPVRSEWGGLLPMSHSLLRNELGIPLEVRLLIYVGRITFNRGLEELVLSLKHLEDCCLVCMGSGIETYKRGLLDLAERTGVADRFFFFGPVPPEEVIHFAAGADLGVAPIANACLSYYYCSPNKLFEYMHAGLPIIASAFPELKKVVLEHGIGLTFDPSDPQDIARAARRILDDPEGMERMRENALKASSLYNWENESRKLLQIYAALQNSA